MFSWLRRRFSSRPKVPELPGETAPKELPPLWAAGLAEALQKSARAQARLTLQVEDLDRKLEGGLAELRSSLSSRKGAAPGGTASEPRWGELLDALDLLEEAIRLADPASASGLAGVKTRLMSFLDGSGLTRMAPLGQPPDGRFFRVVGTEPHPSLTEGSIVRLVRAAVLREGHLLREGEAITVRNPPS